MIWLATQAGVVGLDGAGRMRRALEGRVVRCVSAQGAGVLAGTPEGLYRSGDGGATWAEVLQGYVRWVAHTPEGVALAGLEPAEIAVSRDGGVTWRLCAEVAALREKHEWYLPYSPYAGCVRDFAWQGTRVYAAAEVGGVLCSDDGGATWQLTAGSTGVPEPVPGAYVNPDVHSVVTHAGVHDLVWAATGGGLYRSDDCGMTWQLVYACYCRAVWLDPHDPEHVVFGPADFVDRRGRIEESHDGGRTWQACGTGLSTPWPRHMVERFAPLAEGLWAVLSNHTVLAATPGVWDWRVVAAEAGAVLAVVPGAPDA